MWLQAQQMYNCRVLTKSNITIYDNKGNIPFGWLTTLCFFVSLGSKTTSTTLKWVVLLFLTARWVTHKSYPSKALQLARGITLQVKCSVVYNWLYLNDVLLILGIQERPPPFVTFFSKSPLPLCHQTELFGLPPILETLKFTESVWDEYSDNRIYSNILR